MNFIHFFHNWMICLPSVIETKRMKKISLGRAGINTKVGIMNDMYLQVYDITIKIGAMKI